MPAPESPPKLFPDTRWTIVVQAGGGADESERERALEQLCRAYWYPLYAFARGRGCAPEEAEDLTQEFFANILRRDLFGRARADLGKLRSFLLGAFTKHIAGRRRADARLKRGGGTKPLPLDLADAEGRFRDAPDPGADPERGFARDWALAIVDAALDALGRSYGDRGRGRHFDRLRPFLEGDAEAASYARAAAELGQEVTAVRQEVHRMRRRYGDALREAIADTLAAPSEEEVEAELAELRRALLD